MMKEKSTIALVDDERNILTSLRMALEAEGYKVRPYNDGVSALEALTEDPADLGIFDIKMPRMDGMELLRRVRQRSDMPVIFLTSKDEEIDELFGLKMGADDYVAKPFSQRLVVERVKAVLRRFQPKEPGSTPEVEAARVLERGKLKLDPERHNCHWDNKPVTLTVTHFHAMPHPMLKKDAIGANAVTKVKRSEFNMGKNVPYVSDDVTLSIAVEAIKE